MYRLSLREVIVAWIVVALASGGILWTDCSVLGGCSPSLVISLLSIGLGFVGTVAMALPSIVRSFGADDDIESGENFNGKMHSAYEKLKNEEIIKRSDPEFDAVVAFLHRYTGYEGDPTTVSARSREFGTYVVTDGEKTDTRILEIAQRMDSYIDWLEAEQERKDAEQERYYNLLGCSIYGLAIIFQSAATVIPNLSSFTF